MKLLITLKYIYITGITQITANISDKELNFARETKIDIPHIRICESIQEILEISHIYSNDK